MSSFYISGPKDTEMCKMRFLPSRFTGRGGDLTSTIEHEWLLLPTPPFTSVCETLSQAR